MSVLLFKIKADQLAARKLKQAVKAKLLTTLIGEASPSGNGIVDNKAVMATITKFLKNARITQGIQPSKELAEEIAILEAYLPETLAGSDLQAFIGRVAEKVHATSMRDMGKIMGKLKQVEYTIDMGEAQKYVKILFAK